MLACEPLVVDMCGVWVILFICQGAVQKADYPSRLIDLALQRHLDSLVRLTKITCLVGTIQLIPTSSLISQYAS